MKDKSELFGTVGKYILRYTFLAYIIGVVCYYVFGLLGAVMKIVGDIITIIGGFFDKLFHLPGSDDVAVIVMYVIGLVILLSIDIFKFIGNRIDRNR